MPEQENITAQTLRKVEKTVLEVNGHHFEVLTIDVNRDLSRGAAPAPLRYEVSIFGTKIPAEMKESRLFETEKLALDHHWAKVSEVTKHFSKGGPR